jgi:hypothetical protein
MRSKKTLMALAVSLLALASTAAWALPPDCYDVCEYRPATYHCYNWPFGTTTCGQFCAMNPGLCGVDLTAAPDADFASCDATIALPAAMPAVKNEASAPADLPEVFE